MKTLLKDGGPPRASKDGDITAWLKGEGSIPSEWVEWLEAHTAWQEEHIVREEEHREFNHVDVQSRNRQSIGYHLLPFGVMARASNADKAIGRVQKLCHARDFSPVLPGFERFPKTIIEAKRFEMTGAADTVIWVQLTELLPSINSGLEGLHGSALFWVLQALRKDLDALGLDISFNCLYNHKVPFPVNTTKIIVVSDPTAEDPQQHRIRSRSVQNAKNLLLRQAANFAALGHGTVIVNERTMVVD
ncbi:hypothetical protein AC1031_012118 [Aphanomyces cochlioides]|nr:hypothetical protein AC1031_012118 [Aphanomyces cochlioides]